MIDRIADHVHQRIVENLDHVTVDLSIRASRLKLDGLSRLVGQIAHKSGHLWNVPFKGTSQVHGQVL